MKYFQSSPAARAFFFIVSANIWLGIGLTGFGVAHGWLYVPGGFLLFAAVTGFCPGMIISRLLFKENQGLSLSPAGYSAGMPCPLRSLE